jgi:hypothetical protein
VISPSSPSLHLNSVNLLCAGSLDDRQHRNDLLNTSMSVPSMSNSTRSKRIAPGQTIKVLDLKKGLYSINVIGADGYTYLPDSSGFSMTVERGLAGAIGGSAFVKGQPQPIFGGRSSYYAFEVLKSSAVRIEADSLTGVSGIIELDYKMKNADLGARSATCWKVGKVDAMTGIAWDNGVVSPQASGSGIKIQDELGEGKDLSDMISFRITGKVPQAVRIQTEGAIAELIYKKQVVIGSDDGYSSNLSTTLTKGTYYLKFSSEGSTPEPFTSQVKIGA